MGQVSFEVNGQPYQLSCDDGQEARLESLAGAIDEKIAEIIGSAGHLSQERLLLMAAILLLDEAADEVVRARDGEAAPAESADIRAMLDAAQRIETVAARLETA